MSTTFAMLRKGDGLEPVRAGHYDGVLDTDYINETTDYIVIARRTSGGIRFVEGIDIILEYLPDNTPVYPIDNSPQGIYTIKDLLEASDE